MEILIDNPLTSMYGPYFLILYVIFIIGIIILIKIAGRFVDSTGRIPMPNIPNQIDPFEIAYLRGKEQEMTRSVIFSLIQKNYLEINESQEMIIRINKNQRTDNLTKIEQIAIEWIGNQASTKDIFGKTGLVKQLESYGRAYKEKLENERMLVDSGTRLKFNLIKWMGILTIWGFGFYKVFASILKGKYNVLFILVIAIIGFVVILFLSLPRVSKLGKEYLDRLQLAFSNLRSTVQTLSNKTANQTEANQTMMAGVDPFLLSVGVFGGAILAGTMYDSYNQAFAKSVKQNSLTNNSNDGCGMDCGSCSSDSGSSWSSCSSDSGSSCSSSCSSCSSCGGCGGCS